MDSRRIIIEFEGTVVKDDQTLAIGTVVVGNNAYLVDDQVGWPVEAGLQAAVGDRLTVLSSNIITVFDPAWEELPEAHEVMEALFGI